MTHILRRAAFALLATAMLVPLLLIAPQSAEAQIGGPCLPDVVTPTGAQGGRRGTPTAPTQGTTMNVVADDPVCAPTGETFADSERLSDTVVQARLGVQNGDQDVALRLFATVPAELAASTECTLDASFGRGTETVVPIAADGSLFGGQASPAMPAGSRFVFTCALPIVENCGLVATIVAEWLDASDVEPGPGPHSIPTAFRSEATTPVSPPCEEPEAASAPEAAIARLSISAEAEPRSVVRGDITTWHVTVTNHRNRTMRNGVVTNVLHEGLVPPRTLPDGAAWDPATRTLRLQVPPLAPGESITLTYPTQVAAWSQVPNWITVRSGRQTATAFADVFGLVDYFS